MKAVIYENYGPPEVLKIAEVEKPVITDNEVLVKVYASAVTVGDIRVRKADPFLARVFNGLLKPKKKILGMNFSGKVEECGQKVKQFHTGDFVFGSTEFEFGTYAEYLKIREDKVITRMATNMSFEEAAVIPFGTLTSLHFLRKGKVEKGKKVLIYGASGSLGTAGVQLARYFETEIIAVCGTKNLELVKLLGADHVVDYKKENFTERNEKYDIIYDAVGKSPFSDCINCLADDGYYLRSVHMGVLPILRGIWTKITSHKNIIGGISVERQEDLEFLKGLYEKGKFKPVLDRVYSVDQAVEAHRYVETGHKKGNVALLFHKRENT
jgi:NADPH:quinone reductase-like Zn-dependent oxidoreductase